MELEYPYYTVIGLIVGLIVLLLTGCFTEKQNERRVGMLVVALIVAVGGFLGIRDNIIEVRRAERRTAENEKVMEAEIAKRQALVESLVPYKTGLMSLARQTIQMTAGACDVTCQSYVQGVVQSLPADFPADSIEKGCKSPDGLRSALGSLLTTGKIAAGTSPAINAVINCANKTQPPAQTATAQ